MNRKKKDKKFTTQPYSPAGRVEVGMATQQSSVVSVPTRLGVKPRTVSIYRVGGLAKLGPPHLT